MRQWQVQSSRTLHDSGTVRLELADVELSDGTVVDHYIVRIPLRVVSLVLDDGDGNVLMLHRHRFIVDRWFWDIPAGKVADGEAPAAAAARASLEETGWLPAAPRHLFDYHPSPGLIDQQFGVYAATGAERVREPNPIELDRLEWLPVARVRELIRAGEVGGLSLTSLLWALDAGMLG